MNDASKYEFFAGCDGPGKAIWTSDFSRIRPIAEWQDNMGCVTMTYNPPLKKHMMCVTDGGNTGGYFNTYLLESDQIAGPWKLVTYMKHFGEQGVFREHSVEVHRRRRPHAMALLRGQFCARLERRQSPLFAARQPLRNVPSGGDNSAAAGRVPSRRPTKPDGAGNGKGKEGKGIDSLFRPRTDQTSTASLG